MVWDVEGISTSETEDIITQASTTSQHKDTLNPKLWFPLLVVS
jgi:hypothetical protein